MLKLLILLSVFYSSLSYSAIWEDTETWSMEWEEKYSKWISSDAVQPRMFISKKSKYHGIKADCADAAYALRAIFSMENSLPFKVHTPPSGLKPFGEIFESIAGDKFSLSYLLVS